MATYKLIVVGESSVGKTALIIQLCTNHFLEAHNPTIADSYRKEFVIDGQTCDVEISDTGGYEEYPDWRDQCIQNGDGFLLVYSVSSRSSFAGIREHYSRISSSSPRSPVKLVGNKSDSLTEREVSTQDGHALARELGCEFVEASAKDFTNVEKAFYDVIRLLRRQRTQQVRGRTDAGVGNNGDQDPARMHQSVKCEKCFIL